MNSAAEHPLWVLDPGLFFEGGHHASFSRTIFGVSRSRGVPCELVGLHRIDHPPQGLPIRRHFRNSAYAVLRSADPLNELRVLNRAMLTDLRTLNEHLRCAHVLFPTVTSRLVLGAAQWIVQQPSHSLSVSLLLMFPPGFAGPPSLRDAERALYAEAFELLSKVPRSRARLFAETPQIAEVFRELGAPEIRPLQWPVTLPELGPARSQPAPEPRIAYLGYSKVERGFALLPACIKQVHRFEPNARFFIQSNYWDPTGLEEADARLTRMESVEVHRGPLAPDAYCQRLSSAEIVLLPYKPEAYRRRGSGVFVEAAALGRIIVLPRGTWMADQAREFSLGAVEFESFNASSVVDAVRHAIQHRDALLAKAALAAPAWRNAHDPDRFFETVLGCARAGSEQTARENAA